MKRPAFTLIELLVVIAIIGLLATFSVVQLASSREKARVANGLSMNAQLLRGLGDETLLQWDFEECSGTSVADLSGSSVVGTLANATMWSTNTPNANGCSLLIDASGEYVAGATKGVPLANNSFTISAWASRKTVGVYNNIVSVGTTGGTSLLLHFGFRDTNTFMCAFFGNDLDTSRTVTDDKWHHYTCTFDATTKQRKIYIDGTIAASDVATGNFIGPNTIQVGHTYGGSNQYNGLIDDVRIYGRSMNATEVEKMYAEGAKETNITKR